MVGFFDEVGAGHTAGYGFTEVPKDPPGLRERNRKAARGEGQGAAAVGS